ncbi:50S ribosomal protein L7/L12 [bacterium]|nr:50S ribosomal protein L7/L12 [bacterium]
MGTSENIQKLVKQIEKLTVLELAELVKALEDKFGVTAATPVAVAAPQGAQAKEEAAVKEEKTSFTVYLKSYGEKKIPVIKEVRGITGLALKEAKEFVEGELPRALKENASKEEAEEIKKKLEAVGATVEIK